MTAKTQQSRVDALVRLVGFLVFALGGTLAYFTYIEAAAAGIVPQIVPVFYLIATLLLFFGLLAMAAKFR
ncbi:MAG: hypothetical protein E6K86_07460 [Thaumarchaeota archaeon]|nr:MAG: hypothetical protein E6K86_07460 [Nitrososphaerota archaeon]